MGNVIDEFEDLYGDDTANSNISSNGYTVGEIIGTDKIIDIYSDYTNIKGRNGRPIRRTFLKLMCVDCNTERDVQLCKYNNGSAKKCNCKVGKRGAHSKMTLETDTYVRDATVEERLEYSKKYGDKSKNGRKCIVIRCNKCGRERVTAEYRFFGSKGNVTEKCECHVKPLQKDIDALINEYKTWVGKEVTDFNLKILGIFRDDRHHMMFKVQCTLCSKVRNIRAHDLVFDNRITKRCECDSIYNPYTLYKGEELNKKLREKYKDKLNKIYGFLLALDVESSNNNGTIVKCKCMRDGKYIDLRASDVFQGRIKSCGCITSYGESLITDILDDNNIEYIREYSFSDLKDKHRLRFDFAVFINDQIKLIEFDGRQHFDDKHTYFDLQGEDALKTARKHDNLKDSYCIDNNIPLLRIPYTKTVEEIKELLLSFLYN